MEFNQFSSRKIQSLAQCLASYFGDPGKFFMFFSIDFKTSTGQKLQKENHRENHGTRKCDDKEINIATLKGVLKLFFHFPFPIYYHINICQCRQIGARRKGHGCSQLQYSALILSFELTLLACLSKVHLLFSTQLKSSISVLVFGCWPF